MGLALPAAGAATDARAVGQAIAARRSRVEEFRVIKEAAEELGFRVWLFGGTAAGFAHYVRWDLAREAGDPRYRETFFDYDFTNIYRSTQDADLVVDATAEQAAAMEALIKERMSFLQGSKDQWEVRLLRHRRTAPGGQVKLPLLGNPDFLEQNTDSNSTGMVELTDPPPGESVVRDLRDWESPAPFFLQDVARGGLHYYVSPTHQRTSRFKSGDNPPLFSVIRYLVKAFQYDLQVDGEDLARVKAIIEAFDPGRDYAQLSPWAKGWLERYAPNLIRHAVNVEYAWDTLEALGLRSKLISLSSPSRPESVGWWLSREPLRTGPVGHGDGKTAAELGIEVVAHETRDFLAYESITRDTTLRPNVLVSREGAPGEAAAFGAGFYTRTGRAGARGTGLTIRFKLDPRAREGTDFTVRGDYVIVRNRAALKVIPETLDLSTLRYFEMLREGLGSDPSDRGIWMKLKRRLSIRRLSQGEGAKVAAVVAGAIGEKGEQVPGRLWREWLELPVSGEHPEVFQALLGQVGAALERQDPSAALPPLLKDWFSDPVSSEHPELEEKLLGLARESSERQIVRSAADHSPWRSANRELLPFLLDWFKLPQALRHPELVRDIIERGNSDERICWDVLGSKDPRWAEYPELAFALLAKGAELPVMVHLLSQEQWAAHPDLFRTILDRGERLHDDFLASAIIGNPIWKDHPEFVETLIQHAGEAWRRYLAAGGESSGDIRDTVAWSRSGGPLFHSLASTVLTNSSGWAGNPALVRSFVEVLPRSLLISPGRTTIPMGPLFAAPSLADHPEILVAWARHTDASWDPEIDGILAREQWRTAPTLRALCRGNDPTAACLRDGPEEGLSRVERFLGPREARECPGG